MKLRSTTPSHRLTIYLNDHRAMAAAETDVADRCRAANLGSDLATDLTRHIGHVTTDLELLDDLIEQAGGSIDWLKTTGARVMERLGRLKLNGQVTGYSPLSRVVELEAILASAHSRQALWMSLCVTHPPITSTKQIDERATAINEQVETIEHHLRRAATVAFDPDRSGSE